MFLPMGAAMIPANNPAEHVLFSFVDACGSKRSAAHRLGIPRGTLRRWLLDIERTGKINAAESCQVCAGQREGLISE